MAAAFINFGDGLASIAVVAGYALIPTNSWDAIAGLWTLSAAWFAYRNNRA